MLFPTYLQQEQNRFNQIAGEVALIFILSSGRGREGQKYKHILNCLQSVHTILIFPCQSKEKDPSIGRGRERQKYTPEPKKMNF